MSPEQARGEEVDKRTDIFAFGCVLYELLTGRRTFAGKTVTDTLAKVLEGVPDWKALPNNTPWRIQELLRRCLTKDAHDRLRDIANIRTEIKLALEEPTTVSPAGVVPHTPSWKRVIPWAVAGLMAVITVLALWSSWRTPSSPEASTLRRFNLAFPGLGRMTGGQPFIALSPDGRHFFYLGENDKLHHHLMDRNESSPLDGTENADQPFISPDSDWLGFRGTGKVAKVPISGGAVQTIFAGFPGIWGLSWGPEGDIFIGSSRGLHKVSSMGGTPEKITTPDASTSHVWPEALPDGRGVLFTVDTGSAGTRQIAVLSLMTGEWEIVLEGGSFPKYSPTGHLLYVQSGTLMAVPFDLDDLEVQGDPISVMEDIQETILGAGHFAVSGEGTLIHLPSRQSPSSTLVWVDRDGTETIITEEERNYAVPRVAPDGTQVAVSVLEAGSPRSAWIYDLEDTSFSRLTFGNWGAGPLWSPDGRWLVYAQEDGDGPTRSLYRQRSDLSSPAESLGVTGSTTNSWSPDSTLLSVHRGFPRTSWDIGIVRVEDAPQFEPFISTPAIECCSKFSPDGKWLAYVSDELGQPNVYLTRYPEGEIKLLISGEEGGGEPVWSPDGSELFYRSGDKMMLVPIQTEPRINVGSPEVLFEGSYRRSGAPAGFQYYDVFPDGQRFLMLKPNQESTGVNVALNWFEELKRLVPTN
jgi:Tol biopolymer transport system component